MSAPEWDQGWMLSWSGRWHIPREIVNCPHGLVAKTYCGTTGYSNRDALTPVHLRDVVIGELSAPLCKKCAKAKSAQETTRTK